MDGLRRDSRELFLRRVKSKSQTCHVLEISGSGDNTVFSERRVSLGDIQAYLKTDPGQPTLRLVRFMVDLWTGDLPVLSKEFAWLPNTGKELGIEPYLIGHLARNIMGFQTMERDIRGAKVLNAYINCLDLRFVASYTPATRSTTCFLFTLDNAEGQKHFAYLSEYVRQNKRLFQDRCFLALVSMALAMNASFIRIRPHVVGTSGRFDEEVLQVWDADRTDLRYAQAFLSVATDSANYIQTWLQADTAQGQSVPQDILDDSMVIKEAFNILELGIIWAGKHIEWRLKQNDDYMARVSRKLMRRDTIASIELTKAAKIDSSSMKVIAVMTMIFLPGTFFATLFAVPSLHWDNEDIVGGNFWMYWAFTIPFTVFIVILWLAITQRQQMRSAVRAGMKQWSSRSALLKEWWRPKEPARAAEKGYRNV
ncbi:hypothetical protein F5Y13DRAFT_95193 [Hypoxylon sp. FL1857]|nr:hypothetical protein F5Y13DRAFT_95193 [Hypoxylon sp. FL1857]